MRPFYCVGCDELRSADEDEFYVTEDGRELCGDCYAREEAAREVASVSRGEVRRAHSPAADVPAASDAVSDG